MDCDRLRLPGALSSCSTYLHYTIVQTTLTTGLGQPNSAPCEVIVPSVEKTSLRGRACPLAISLTGIGNRVWTASSYTAPS